MRDSWFGIYWLKMANGWGFAMGSPVPLRDDHDAASVRMLARRTWNSNQSRRLLALAAIYDGGSRGDAARIGSVGLQKVRLSRQAGRACGRSASGPRQRVLRFNAAGSEGLVDGKAPGQPPKLNKARRQALVRIVESGPIPAVQEVVRWRLGGAIMRRTNTPSKRSKKFLTLVEDIARRKAAGAKIDIWFQDGEAPMAMG